MPHAEFGFVDEAVEHVEEVGSRHGPGHRRSPGVVDQHVPLERRPTRKRFRAHETRAEFVVIGDAVEAVPARVDHDGLVGRRQRHVDGFGRGEDDGRVVAVVVEVDGDDPSGIVVERGVGEPLLAELKLGGTVHDINWTGLGNGEAKERSLAINGEILFNEPEFLKWALSPQPYIGGTLNLEGETSHGGAGLLWRQTLSDKFCMDFSFGLVAHTGTIEVTPSPLVQQVIDNNNDTSGFTPAQEAQFAAELAEFRDAQQSNIDYGSRILFRQQLAFGYRWNETWSTQVFVEHLSHGRILVSGRPNEGLDNIGLRASYHF